MSWRLPFSFTDLKKAVGSSFSGAADVMNAVVGTKKKIVVGGAAALTTAIGLAGAWMAWPNGGAAIKPPAADAAAAAGHACLDGINQAIANKVIDLTIDSTVPAWPIKAGTVLSIWEQGNDLVYVYHRVLDHDENALFDANRVFYAIAGDTGTKPGELFALIGPPAVSCAQAQLYYEQELAKDWGNDLRLTFNRYVDQPSSPVEQPPVVVQPPPTPADGPPPPPDDGPPPPPVDQPPQNGSGSPPPADDGPPPPPVDQPPQNGSGTPQNGSGTPQNGSGTPQTGGGTPPHHHGGGPPHHHGGGPPPQSGNGTSPSNDPCYTQDPTPGWCGK